MNIELLRRGGDHRLVARDDGLSAYRVAIEPRNTAPLGSCTASTPGPRAYQAALDAIARLDQGVEALQMTTRDEMHTLFELPDGVTSVLTPSGTDAVYLVSALALTRAENVHHVVVGASELGGGTMRASRGLTFSTSAPSGDIGEPGRPIPGLAERCSAEAVYLREHDGGRLDDEVIDAMVEAAVERAVAPDRVVIVHLVAHSKTGLRAPSLSLCDALSRKHGDRVMILVDAAQGRLSPPDIRRALSHGFVVMFTGSKFYSGPPFSGVLFLPATLAADPGPLPEGLSPWFDRASMPAHWTQARASLQLDENPGLAVRWRAAMAEINAYHSIPPRTRARVYATFAGAVHEVLGRARGIDLEFPLPPSHRLVTVLGAFPTVFGFRVAGREGWLDAVELRKLHADLERAMPGPASLQRSFHLGQPVELGPPGQRSAKALLRVALGARLVTDHAGAPDAGGAWMRETMWALTDKIALLTEAH